MQGKTKSLCCSKYHEEEEIDRISRLPDNLIHEILSFNDMKLAVQTCVLSKRWRNIWMSLPSITLVLDAFAQEKTYSMDRFVGFVDKVFDLRDDSDIQNLNLGSVIHDDASIETHNRWIIAAVTRNVLNLTVVVAYSLNSPYEFPQQLLNCRSLKSLGIKLGGRQFGNRYTHVIVPKSMSLPQIEALCLDGISISNLDLQRLFSSCPCMEKVMIRKCNIQTENQRNIIIDFQSLEAFQLIDNRHTRLGWGDHSLTYTTKISAPNVKSFTFKGCMTEDFSLENLSSLIAAHLNMRLREDEADETAETYYELPAEEKEVFAKRMMKFLGAVQKVQQLILSSGFLEVLLQAPSTLYHQPPQLRNLESLQLEMRYTRGCLRSIAYLLKISPVIMTLILESKESNLADVGDDWDEGFSLTCMFSHLKFVEISEVEGCDNELKFLRFLLKNSMALEKVNLFFQSTSDLLDNGRQLRRFMRNVKHGAVMDLIMFEEKQTRSREIEEQEWPMALQSSIAVILKPGMVRDVMPAGLVLCGSVKDQTALWSINLLSPSLHDTEPEEYIFQYKGSFRNSGTSTFAIN